MKSPKKWWLQGVGFTRVLLTVGVISTVHSAIFRIPVAAQQYAELKEVKQQEQLLKNRQQAIQKNITLLQDQDAEVSNSAARALIGLEAKEATSQLLSLGERKKARYEEKT